MKHETLEFIELVESHEKWVFTVHGDDMLNRAEKIASLIIKDGVAANRVPIGTWVVFTAQLPYSKALDAVADLTRVIPKFVESYVRHKSSNKETEIARSINIERLNTLLRKQLHLEVLTTNRKRAIQVALRYLDNGNN